MTATEIIPNLFLGTREDAEAIGARVPDGWVCVSVTEYRSRYGRKEELPNEPEGSLDMPFMADRPVGWHADGHKLDLIAETIWWRLLHGKKVLVHCIHAQERSPLAAAWYLAWCGEASSFSRAYDLVARLHPRTERRDKWLRGATPGSRQPELAAMLAAARALIGTDPRVEGLRVLEATALAWAARLPVDGTRSGDPRLESSPRSAGSMAAYDVVEHYPVPPDEDHVQAKPFGTYLHEIGKGPVTIGSIVHLKRFDGSDASPARVEHIRGGVLHVVAIPARPK